MFTIPSVSSVIESHVPPSVLLKIKEDGFHLSKLMGVNKNGSLSDTVWF